jgi:hypothetical protein
MKTRNPYFPRILFPQVPLNTETRQDKKNRNREIEKEKEMDGDYYSEPTAKPTIPAVRIMPGGKKNNNTITPA